MSTNIGTEAWIQNAIKAAKDNRANQLNPNCPVYWASRSILQPKFKQPSPLAAIFAAAAIGAAATAGSIFLIQKILREKQGDEEEEFEDFEEDLESKDQSEENEEDKGDN